MPYFILSPMKENIAANAFSDRSQQSLHRVRAGFLASGSFYLPRLPILITDSGYMAAFVNGYSGGTATDLHRFPY